MHGPKRIAVIFLLLVMLLTVFTGTVAAKYVLYDDYIQEVDGYQINNYVIDVTDIFPSNDYASFHIYNKDTEILDAGLGINRSFTFEIEGEEVEVKLLDVASGTYADKARVVITISNENVVDEHKYVDGGHEYADFSGTPVLHITKSVSSQTIKVGDIIRVTVSVENSGDDTATNIIFSDPPSEKFVLEESFYSPSGKMSLDVGATQTIFVYEIRATEAGVYTLKPSTATFSNKIGQDFPQASSNTVTVTVEGEAVKTPELHFTVASGQSVVPRDESIDFTIHIENMGKGVAKAVSVGLLLPEGLEYEDGDAEIEIIGGVPTIYLESFGVQQEKEITFTAKAKSMGSYTITGDYSYFYDNGLEDEKASGDFTSGTLVVEKGKYDRILEQPIYVYIVPALVIIGIAAWLVHRHRQYRF